MVGSMNNKIHENKKENIQQNEKEEKIFKFEHDDEKDNEENKKIKKIKNIVEILIIYLKNQIPILLKTLMKK